MTELEKLAISFEETFTVEEHQKLIGALKCIRSQFVGSPILNLSEKRKAIAFYDDLIKKIERGTVVKTDA